MRHWIGLLGAMMLLSAALGSPGCGDPNNRGLGVSCSTWCQARTDGDCLISDQETCNKLCTTFGLGSSDCSQAAQYINECRVSSGTSCGVAEGTGDPCAAEQGAFDTNCGSGAQ